MAPLAEKRTKGAWDRQWRLISLDGSRLDTADTAENEKAFGRPGASRGSSAFPQIQWVALLENGTHVLWAARMSNCRTDEITLAQAVAPALRQGMLCLADRFFPGYKLWRSAARSGADLLWRTRQNARLDVDRRLPDGSHLISAAFTLPLQIDGTSATGLWSAGSTMACGASKTLSRFTG